MSPAARKLSGMFVLLSWMTGWSVAMATLAGHVVGIHWTISATFFVAAGIAWIAPLKPLLRWMETGKWRLR